MSPAFRLTIVRILQRNVMLVPLRWRHVQQPLLARTAPPRQHCSSCCAAVSCMPKLSSND